MKTFRLFASAKKNKEIEIPRLKETNDKLSDCFVLISTPLDKGDLLLNRLLEGKSDKTYSVQINNGYLKIYKDLSDIKDKDLYFATNRKTEGQAYILRFLCTNNQLSQLAENDKFSIAICSYFDAVVFKNEKLSKKNKGETINKVAAKIEKFNYLFNHEKLNQEFGNKFGLTT